MLSDDVKKEVEEMLKNMEEKVEIVFHEDPNAQMNNEIKNLLNEVVEIKPDLLSLKIDSEGAERPCFELKGKNKGKVRFMGIPSGHEFSTLISSIVMTSNGKHGLSSETVQFLESLDKPLDLKVFITPTCPYCPRAVFLAHQMAMASEKVSGAMVEAMEFPEPSRKFGISSVPHTIINDQPGGFVGAHPEESAVAEIKKALGM